jgi:glycogen operon protein
VGQFPPGWAEWNDRFRDTVRAYWKGDAGTIGDLAARVTGSADLFNRRGRRPFASINFVTAHDGFTLNDLVSYDDKHNEANGEDNRDGHSDNRSWNHGAEGPTDDPDIIALRERQRRNLMATLLLSQGTPMLLAGDEFGRSQRGNNNSYAQDNEVSWIRWDEIDAGNAALIDFTRRLTQLRREHPLLRHDRFFTGAIDPETGQKDILWLSPSGAEMAIEQWKDPRARCMGMLLSGSLLMILNSYHDVVLFTLPKTARGREWRCLIDTNRTDLEETPTFPAGHVYQVTGRSLLLLETQPGSISARSRP